MDTFNEVNRVAPWFFPLIAALVGACVGSFLNVCIYRIPKGESIVRPGSHCGCGQPIAWYDNIPVLSWLILRGRARCCGRAFSVRYPAVELLTAALFLTCWLQFPPGKAVSGAVLCCLVICAFFIDRDGMIIPDVFTVGGAATGVFLAILLPSTFGQSHPFFALASLRASVDSLLGLCIGSSVVLWIALWAEALLKKEAMGFGDVKFLGALGAFVGWKGAVFSMFGGAMLGCAWVAAAWSWQKITGRTSQAILKSESPDGQPAELGLGVHVPFGPMLGVAALIYFFGLHQRVDAYFDSLKILF